MTAGQTFVVGLPVIVTVLPDGNVNAYVDFSELTDAMEEEGANPPEDSDEENLPASPEALAAAEKWVDETWAPCVAFPKREPDEVIDTCGCGAPVARWRTSTPDGDSEPHGHCLNASCALSTY